MLIGSVLTPTPDPAVTDYTAQLQSLLNQGGQVFLPAGTYVVSNPNPLSAAYALNVTQDNTVIRGAGRGRTTIQLAPSQVDFTRIFNLQGRNNVTIEGLTIDGNNANQAGYPSGNNVEHQACVFLWGGSNIVCRDLELMNSGGDGIYLYSNPSRVAVANCFFHDNRRVPLNVQQFTDCSVTGCLFFNAQSEPHIKCEPDNPGQYGDGLTVSGCTFRGNSGAYGITISGLDASTVFRNVTIQGNTFRDLAWAITLGQYGENWSIIGNTVFNCPIGITSYSYNVANGYTSNRSYAIVGNVIGGLTGSGAGNVGIGLSNMTNAVVSGNLVRGDTNTYAYLFQHCDGLTLDGRGEVGASNGAVVILYRCKRATVQGDYYLPNGAAGSKGISLQDDATYPSSNLYVADSRIWGPAAVALDGTSLFGTTVSRANVVAPSAVAISSGTSVTA